MRATVETQPRTRCPVLVLGIGNILMGDEGVGVRVVEAMQGMDLPAGVELFDGATAGIDLLDVLAERRKVVVIDALDSDDEPGTVVRLTPDDLGPKSRVDLSAHELGLMEMLVMARHLGIAPGEVVVLGVRPDRVEASLELSPLIASLVPKVIELVFAELDDGR